MKCFDHYFSDKLNLQRTMILLYTIYQGSKLMSYQLNYIIIKSILNQMIFFWPCKERKMIDTVKYYTLNRVYRF